MLKACAICGELTPGTYCDEHRPKDNRPEKNDPARGYDAAWQRLSRRARKLQPFCTDCGTTKNLTADHKPEAWRRRARGLTIRLQDVEVVCMQCNIARGAARGGSVTRTD